MFAGKTLRCECGFEVRAYADDDFVAAIRRHAWEEHGIDFSVALALDVARGARVASGEHLELERNGVIGRKEGRMLCDGD